MTEGFEHYSLETWWEIMVYIQENTSINGWFPISSKCFVNSMGISPHHNIYIHMIFLFSNRAMTMITGYRLPYFQIHLCWNQKRVWSAELQYQVLIPVFAPVYTYIYIYTHKCICIDLYWFIITNIYTILILPNIGWIDMKS